MSANADASPRAITCEDHKLHLLDIKEKRLELEEMRLVVEAQKQKLEQEKNVLELEKRAFELEMKQQRDVFESYVKQQKDEMEQRLKGLQDDALGLLFAPPQSSNDVFISSLPLPNVTVVHKDTVDAKAPVHVDSGGTQSGLLEQLALKTRQLKTISQLAQNRYDDAIRSEQRASQMFSDAEQLQQDHQAKVTENVQLVQQNTQLVQQNAQLNNKLQLQQFIFVGRSHNVDTNDPTPKLTKKQIGTEIQSLFGLTNHQHDAAVSHILSAVAAVVSDDNTNALNVQQKYPPERLDLCCTFKLNPENALMLVEMSDTEYQSEPTQKKIKICKALVAMKSNPSKLSPMVLCNTIFSMSPMELAPFKLESMSTYKYLCGIAATLEVNLEGWGKEEATPCVEYHFPQLDKQFHFGFLNHFLLLPVLYRSTPSVSVPSQFVHPLDPTISDSLHDDRILSHYFKPLLDDGTISPLTPNLKLFFSTQHVADGEWIQFHGPGTLLFDHYTKYPLTLSALCPKGKGGAFTSDDWDQSNGIISNQGRFTSKYRISIKWETK